MFDAGNKYKRNDHGFHFVIMCDEAGIFNAFNYVKVRLAYRGIAFISLIYSVSEKNTHPLFEQELSILEKRFSEDIIVHILRIDATKYFLTQELIEATINSNTLPVMKFSVFGNDEFVNYVYEVLRFLDVKAFMISSKTI
jgi:hypothetical protein